MIPKVIHYCWFGDNPLPEEALRCIESWKKYLPGYEIKEWNESNFDISCCDYVKEAYESKKWAFVSDYARFWIIYNYGGIYFDTDVEIIRPIDDILERGAFMGIERSSSINVAPGLGIAAHSGLDLYEQILDFYKSSKFINLDGTLNKSTVVYYVTEILKTHGFMVTNSLQSVCGVTIYPSDYFCPMDYETGVLNITSNTRSIHHYSASWHNEMEKYSFILSKKLMLYCPKYLAKKIAIIVAILRYQGIKALFRKILNVWKGYKNH